MTTPMLHTYFGLMVLFFGTMAGLLFLCQYLGNQGTPEQKARRLEINALRKRRLQDARNNARTIRRLRREGTTVKWKDK